MSSRSPYLSSRKATNSASLLSPYKSCSSLHLWNDALLFILVFSLARSSYFFLHCFSLSVFLFLLFDMGNGGAFFQLCCCCRLLSTIVNSLGMNVSDQGRAGTAPARYALHEGGCQQLMHENDWHSSDTPLGSHWMYWAGSGGFLQINSQPLCCLFSDPFDRKVELKHIASTCCLLHISVRSALARDAISGWRLCCEL